jgi:hypothetical protein
VRRISMAVLAMVVVAAVALTAQPAGAISVPIPPKPNRLTVSGFVIGRLAKGNKVRIGFVAFDPLFWADLSVVKAALLLRGQVLEDLSFFVHDQTLQVGDRAPVSIESRDPVTSGFFQVNPQTVRMIRYAHGIRVIMWAHVRESIPNGTTFRVIAKGSGDDLSYARVKVAITGGFLTWGIFALGFVLALLLGMALARARAAKRFRAEQPSVWDVLVRRLREERGWQPSLATAAAGSDGS